MSFVCSIWKQTKCSIPKAWIHFDRAIDESQELVALGNPLGESALGLSLAAAGRTNEALEILSRLIPRFEQSHSGAFQIAMIYDNTLRWLEEANRQHDQSMPILKLGPDFKYLHDDPDFQDLVRRIGIPD